MEKTSLEIAKSAIEVAMTQTRQEERKKIQQLSDDGIQTVAIDIGGNLLESIPKVIERSIIASRRTHLIEEKHVLDGAVAGAARDAIMQVAEKATGLNVGGKIGIARSGEHLTVCIFMSIGLLHLNEVAIGLAHRSIPVL